MKVLIATTYIYKKEWPEFTRNRTGFGIMVNEIFESISEKTDAYLLSQVITEGHGNVLKHTWGDVFRNARIRDWAAGIKNFFRYKQDLKGRTRYFYYAFNAGSIRKAIRQVKPDVVHIHGIGTAVKPYIQVCQEEKIPFVVTLHGLIGLDDTILAPQWDRQLEREFIIEADKKNIPVTVISSGMRKRIEENYLHHAAGNISVICNGTKVPYDEKLLEIRSYEIKKEYALTDEKIIVVIGSICERKNQIQIVKALVADKVTTPCHVFFCGADTMNGELQNLICEAGLQDMVHFLGFQSHEKVEDILRQADLNVVASKDEGFGLSIIEAYSYGVPTVTFADLDAISDLYDERAMIKVDSRDDISLAEGIEAGLKKTWDTEWIREYSKSFSLEKFAEKYQDEYNQLLRGGGYASLAKTLDYLRIRKYMGNKVLAYVGNITDNKNQIKLAQIMSEVTDKKMIAVFAGREVDSGRVRNYVIENELEDYIVLAGFCVEMSSIWDIADLNVFFSKNDGFGLSVIEGFTHGVPSIMMDDLDAAEDVVINYGIKYVSRNDDNLLLEISTMTSTTWDRNRIMQNAKRFSREHMRDEYVNILQESV